MVKMWPLSDVQFQATRRAHPYRTVPVPHTMIENGFWPANESVPLTLRGESGSGDFFPIGFQDVAFLPSRTSFPPYFLKNCGRGESLRITTCPKTVIGGKQGHAHCRILMLFCVS